MEEITALASTLAGILVAMGVLAVLEALIPLRARGPWSRAHIVPNLALTLLAIAANAVLGGALVLALARARDTGFGLLPLVGLSTWIESVVVLLVLDLSFYVAHVAMHRSPLLWRFHRVHHSDPAVDVTTTIRQHPGESVIRYAFTAAFALVLGASPEAFAIYRGAVALSGLLEHATIRVPGWLDTGLALVFTWPSVHKVHHARDVRLTDTNFGNLLSWWDRLFATFTPAHVGRDVDYGLDGLDDRRTQSTLGLLALPFRGTERTRDADPLRSDDATPRPVGAGSNLPAGFVSRR